MAVEIPVVIDIDAAFASAAKRVPAAVAPLQQSIEKLNEDLAVYREVMNESHIDSADFRQAAKEIQNIAQALEVANDKFIKLSTNEGSIKRMSAELESLNRRWNEMGAAQKYTAGGELSADAKQLVADYKRVTAELQKSGKTLAQMEAEEKRLLDLAKRRAQLAAQGVQSRKYEQAILNSTVKTMRVLQEQERILSDRLSRTTIGSSKYEQLKTQLQEVRQRIAEVNSELNGTQVQTADLNVLLGKADNRLTNLVKRSIQLVALHSATGFIRNIREVTSEFEMQRVALAGIIQDSASAESLFKQIKAAAIKSPFEIKELVTYTKQMSAYRIETDKLFDTTMRLADVSAGLGVDMNRLVLAYGQIRAASVLRGQEVRQLTEAGIPVIELLAEKFSQLNGRMVSTADVFDLISKRAVPFSMIEEIFNDMTDAGGMFYKMQEKQSETLLGQWQKLKDALSIMYDEMGNTAAVHGTMEKMLADAMKLMQNWRLIAGVVKALGIQFVALKALSAFMPSLTRNVTLAKNAEDALARSIAAAEMAAKTGSASFKRSAERFARIAYHLDKASRTTNIFRQSWHRLAASMVGGGWIGIVTTAATSLIGYLVAARKEAQRLGKELNQNIAKGALQIDQSARNFKRLADAAVQAAEGSSEQREALKELQRTYGDIIPSQDLQIEKLRALKGNYDSLTDAIRQKIEMQIHEQNVNQIQESYGSQLGMQRKGLEKYLKQQGFSTEEANRIIGGITKAINDELLTSSIGWWEAGDIIQNIIEEQIGEPVERIVAENLMLARATFSVDTYYKKLLNTTEKYNSSMADEDDRFKGLNNVMGHYADVLKEIREELKKAPKGFTLEQADTFEFNQARWKQATKRYKEELTKAFGNVDISEAFATPWLIDFSKITDKITQSNSTKELKAFVEGIQKDYLNIAPQEATTRLVTQAATGFADEVGIAMTKVQGYLKKDETTMTDYAKSVEDFVKAQKLRIQTLEFEQKNYHPGVSNYIRPSDEDVANEQKELSFLEKLLEFVKEFLKQKTPKGGSGQDPWIILYKNRMKFMQDFQKGVEDLDKYLAHSASLGREQGIMKGRGLSLGIKTEDLLGTPDELRKWYDKAIKDVVKKIKSMGGREFTGLGVTEILAKDLTGRKIQKYQELLQELWKGLTDFDTNQMKKNLDKQLKRLSDEIKRSETARDFYTNILGLTGDEELAASVAVSVYGGIGQDFKQNLQTQLNTALASLDPETATDELKKAFAEQDFATILANLDKFPEEWQKRLKEMADANQKYNADLTKDLLKELEKAKSYGEKRVELAKKNAERIRRINEMSIPEAQKAILRNRSNRKEAEEVAKLQYEAFKDSPMYVHLFENLDQASTKMLTNMRDNLIRLKENWKDLDPVQLKEMQKRLEEIDAQLVRRNPFKAIADGFRAFREQGGRKGRKNAEGVAGGRNTIWLAEQEVLDTLLAEYEAMVNSGTATAEELEAKKAEVDVQEALTDAAKEAADDAENTAESFEAAVKAIAEGVAGLKEWAGYLENMTSSVKGLLSEVLSDDDASYVNEQIDNSMKILQGGVDFASGLARVLAGDVTGIVPMITGAVDAVAGIFGASNAKRIAKANTEIEKQQRLLDNLAYSYNRLADAEEKAFGAQYIQNYNERLANLQAQADAYQAQADAEESKGKKKDKDKIQQYKDAARDTYDKIVKMQDEVTERLTGTTLASAARDFASAWIDAYKSFSSTTDAMSEKFEDMIQNMVVESLAAQLVQKQLEPVFRLIDELAKDDGQFSVADAALVAAKTKEATAAINTGLNNLMSSLGAAGLNLRTMGTGLTGISKDIQGASEESILGLAAGVNTQNFYMSHIDENVAQILLLMQGGTPAVAPASVSPVSLIGDEVFRGQMERIDMNIAEIYSLLRSATSPNSARTNTRYFAIK